MMASVNLSPRVASHVSCQTYAIALRTKKMKNAKGFRLRSHRDVVPQGLFIRQIKQRRQI